MRQLILALVLALTAGAAHAERYVIVGAEVFDGTGAAPFVGSVVVKDGLIESVTPGRKAPGGIPRIEAKGLALLPGFMDLHTHYTPGGEPATAPQISARYVAAGVTTVNDFHEPPESWAARRAWYGEFPGPHVNFAARLSTPGGHGADWADQNTTKWVNTPYAARAAIEALVPYKPDFIKVFSDGWRYGSGIDNTSMDEPTLTALVAAAHTHGWKVGTHTVTIGRGKLAARAGVDIIVHSMMDAPADKELADLMLQHHTALAPTLAVYEPIKPGQKASPDDPAIKARQARFAIALANVKMLHDAGVLIVLGTDAGMPATVHGSSSLREMELLVSAGLTPVEALIAGTSGSAKAMALADRGLVAPGKRADLVLIDGKPWTTISDVRKTVRTFVDGKTVFSKDKPQAAVPAFPKAAALASPQIADFERADGRTNAGALVVTDADGGVDRSVEVIATASREGGGHALAIAARMAQKAAPRTEAILPLAPGGIQPVDARAYHGVRFEARGDGDYALGVATTDGPWAKTFAARGAWTTVSIPFAELSPEKAGGEAGEGGEGAGAQAWTGDDLLAVRFILSKPGGTAAWLEVDNVGFY